MKPTHCIVYRRVSTQAQGDSGLGMDAQLAAIEAFALTNNIKIIQWHEDVASGASTNRIGLQNALAACEQFGCPLIVAKLDRLSRKLPFTIALMEKHDIVFVEFGLMASSLVLNIMAAIAEFEREQISERTKAALKQAKKRGTKLGNPNIKPHPGTAATAAVARAALAKKRAQQKALAANNNTLTV